MTEKKILLIDDNEIICELVTELLADIPVEIQTTTDAREGLRLAMSIKPDLVLLDIDLPEVNGLDLLQQIRNMQSTRHLAVVMLTANEHIASIQRASELGVLGYILKPFKQSYFLERLSTFLGLSLEFENKPTKTKDNRETGKNVNEKAHAIKTKNLLVIDDEPSFGELIGSILKDTLFEVKMTSDPHEGLRWAMTQSVDVILLDLNMPEITGAQIGKQLKKMQTTQKIPILVISGYPQSYVEKELAIIGETNFLEKPFTPQQLITALSKLIGKTVYWQI
ncbi:hypothetical protein COW36_07160 [bacterium (Candidatus Blackallbacteria) CG17_big_fil_post_rev_8_21_14_2_50_48_46]|uniref:Response regulatory domain-containing protein n=1 Tax=bacterium (Candidatus Blackallbacteria) CG17_big_fil_post_rev_8_21_14_2_50_48_46 TaxID=2014261 RepID=A0A2M7G708_9BACT|nr:MAG: hypothetical protein COW64_06670 [bacterium (Candidatus Blackallbacteria) CG18_big_fil_WC_8_21_14_2_50_49_26]PIW17840.1 MAG: hypothetical protein COW36_07160 [bacterium (Candidatus Blackallbacteria) CG17_big_fil_post_rev_8_21_14_2_50_48_46]PIW48516.1 MAG: hypothetical protein COW20_09115 [bacterium (Candidatus Blackallbacteria) CG13_big_fil_rev_8_21_14_2_50_49_14]